MASEVLRPENDEAPPASPPEVEFALVLSRMIDSLQKDPDHLRQTIYELARYKLQEQFAGEGGADRLQLSKALEAAIQGVETFVKKNELAPPPSRTGQAALAPPRNIAQLDDRPFGRPVPPLLDTETMINLSTARRRSWFTTLRRLALILVMGLVAVVAVQRRASIEALISKSNFDGSSASQTPQQVAAPSAPKLAPAQPQAVRPEPSPLVPTSFGIYAISADKLYELDLLPGKAPDLRVAISPLIASPSRTTLPDGHITFIVYRRDSATNAADRAEVRVIAKIEHEMTFDNNGKPVLSKAGAGWVMRNISIPYRTAPKKDDPDMYEVQSEKPAEPLAPGRYALVLKGQSYDFTVEGEVTDPKHCLDRVAATNGQFYSECQKK